MVREFFEHTGIKITTAILACVFVLGVVSGEVAWKVTVARDLREIREKQNVLGWHRSDMERWVLKTELKNSGWDGADVDQRP